MKFRLVAGVGLWMLVIFGIDLILQYTELSVTEKICDILLMLMGSVAFTVYHDSEGS